MVVERLQEISDRMLRLCVKQSVYKSFETAKVFLKETWVPQGVKCESSKKNNSITLSIAGDGAEQKVTLSYDESGHFAGRKIA